MKNIDSSDPVEAALKALIHKEKIKDGDIPIFRIGDEIPPGTETWLMTTKDGRVHRAEVRGKELVWAENQWIGKRGPRKKRMTREEIGRKGGQVVKDGPLRSQSAMHIRWADHEKELIRKISDAAGIDMIDLVRMATMKFVNDTLVHGRIEIRIGHILEGDPERRFKE